MKTFTKCCLIISLVLIMLGGTICLIGTMFGGWKLVDGAVRNSPAFSTWSDQLIRMQERWGGDWGFISDTGYNNDFDFDYDYDFDFDYDYDYDYNYDYDYSYDGGPITNTVTKLINSGSGLTEIDASTYYDFGKESQSITELELDIEAAAFYFQVSDNDNYGIFSDSNKSVKCKQDGSKLTIKIEEKNRIGNHSRGMITLAIPSNADISKLSLTVGAGQVYWDEITADQVTVFVGAGQIYGTKLKCDQMTSDVGAGSLSVEEIDTDYFTSMIGTGRMDIRGKIKEGADVKCGIGSAELILNGKEEDFNYEISSAMGNVTVGDYTRSGIAGSMSLNNEASRDMKLECGMGMLNVQFQ